MRQHQHAKPLDRMERSVFVITPIRRGKDTLNTRGGIPYMVTRRSHELKARKMGERTTFSDR